MRQKLLESTLGARDEKLRERVSMSKILRIGRLISELKHRVSKSIFAVLFLGEHYYEPATVREEYRGSVEVLNGENEKCGDTVTHNSAAPRTCGVHEYDMRRIRDLAVAFGVMVLVVAEMEEEEWMAATESRSRVVTEAMAAVM